ncbi:sugar transferase [Terribacillus saccharophilus]|uniref:sugar transferase n=1 Tax=Terribacillus saccharophilus TaxID=361277 RepID=UPI003D2BA124
MAESKQQQIADTTILVFSDSKLYLISKRLMDISLSLIGIIILLPVFILIAFLIKNEDRKGSIFFKQVRVGKDGSTFKMYKFRSMVSNAEDLRHLLADKNEAEGPIFKIKEDPRITRIGKFIRKTSLDELPQLFNVLIGDMSLVGPRPALTNEVNQYNSFQKQRLKVKPGLTCFWQTQGRSRLGFDEQVQLDLKYILERSLVLDIKLIFVTILVLFGSDDAY